MVSEQIAWHAYCLIQLMFTLLQPMEFAFFHFWTDISLDFAHHFLKSFFGVWFLNIGMLWVCSKDAITPHIFFLSSYSLQGNSEK